MIGYYFLILYLCISKVRYSTIYHGYGLSPEWQIGKKSKSIFSYDSTFLRLILSLVCPP